MASADLLLHPVRLRIVQAFLGDRTLTVGQLAAELGDVSPASLYRHVALLTEAGVLQVAAERRVRAVIERTYMLRVHAAQIQPDEAAAMTPEQHLAAFMACAAGMLADAERYLTTGTPDPLRDGASYRMAAMWLTDAEFADLVRDLATVFQPGSPTRRPRGGGAASPTGCSSRHPKQRRRAQQGRSGPRGPARRHRIRRPPDRRGAAARGRDAVTGTSRTAVDVVAMARRGALMPSSSTWQVPAWPS